MDNSCRRCGWFAEDFSEWPTWDATAAALGGDDPLQAAFGQAEGEDGLEVDEGEAAARRAAREQEALRFRREHHGEEARERHEAELAFVRAGAERRQQRAAQQLEQRRVEQRRAEAHAAHAQHVRRARARLETLSLPDGVEDDAGALRHALMRGAMEREWERGMTEAHEEELAFMRERMRAEVERRQGQLTNEQAEQLRRDQAEHERDEQREQREQQPELHLLQQPEQLLQHLQQCAENAARQMAQANRMGEAEARQATPVARQARCRAEAQQAAMDSLRVAAAAYLRHRGNELTTSSPRATMAAGESSDDDDMPSTVNRSSDEDSDDCDRADQAAPRSGRGGQGGRGGRGGRGSRAAGRGDRGGRGADPPDSLAAAMAPPSAEPLTGARVFVLRDQPATASLLQTVAALGGQEAGSPEEATHCLAPSGLGFDVSQATLHVLQRAKEQSVPVLEATWLEHIAGLAATEHWSEIPFDSHVPPIMADLEGDFASISASEVSAANAPVP